MTDLEILLLIITCTELDIKRYFLRISHGHSSAFFSQVYPGMYKGGGVSYGHFPLKCFSLNSAMSAEHFFNNIEYIIS